MVITYKDCVRVRRYWAIPSRPATRACFSGTIRTGTRHGESPARNRGTVRYASGYDTELCLTVNTLDRGAGCASLVIGNVVGPLCLLPSVTYRCLSPVHMDLTFRLMGCNRSSLVTSSLFHRSATRRYGRHKHGA